MRETFNTKIQIKFKITMLRSSLCDHSDAYIILKGFITVENTVVLPAAENNTGKKVIFKNCAPFTDCISKINNTQIDNAKDIDAVMPMYSLIEDSDNYSKTSGSLWLFCTDKLALNKDDNSIVHFADNNTTDSFKFKEKITRQTGGDGTKNVEILVPLK